MRSLHNFIATTSQRYNNKADVGGKELIVNSEITERDAQFVNRIADVVAIPTAIETPIEPGDQIIVHHNVFRTWYNQLGKLSDGSSGIIDDDKFPITQDQLFAYNKGDGWISAPGFVFVAPIMEKIDTSKLISKHVREVPLRGIVKITNDGFESRTGAVCCSEVGFKPDSEYEFTIDGEKLYRVMEKDIIIIFKDGNKETPTRFIRSTGERLQTADQSA